MIEGLPTLDVTEGPTGKLLEAYKQVLPQLENQYISDSGKLNVKNLLRLMEKVGETEGDFLQQRAQVCGVGMIICSTHGSENRFF